MSNSNNSDSCNGVTGGPTGSLAEKCLFSAFTAVALYNSIELVVLCFTTFKRWRGPYFWSLLIASISIIPLALGFLLKFFNILQINYLTSTMVTIPWWGMVTGQSLVLWSRLHLLIRSPRILRSILCMIMFDAIIFHIPTTVFVFGTNAANPSKPFLRGYEIMERIQLIGFSVQETLISALYIWETVKILKVHSETRRGVLHQLLVINLLIILMDGAVIGVEYAGYYAVQVTFKPMVYSIKLKLEYAVLGKLMNSVKTPRTTESYTSTSPYASTEASSPKAVESSRQADRYDPECGMTKG